MKDSHWGSLLFALSFLVRFVSATGSAVFGTDSGHYLLMADWMRAGRFHDALQVGYHPGYPLLIAVARTFAGSTETAGTAVSVLLGAAAVMPLFFVARGVFGRPAGVIAALLYAFQPAVVEVQSDPMTEGAYMFFFFGTMWLTWKAMVEPGFARSAVLGAAAAGAFLTRPEGLLAVALALAWPAIRAIGPRTERIRRLGGVVLTLFVIVLCVSPYLLWARGQAGRWVLTPRPIEESIRPSSAPAEEAAEPPAAPGRARLYRIYFSSLFRLSLFGALIPFYVLGAARLRGVGGWNGLFYLSFPLGQLGGILWAARTHNFMSERYVMAGMVLLGAVAARGMEVALRWAARAWPEARWKPVALGGLLLLLVVPVLKCFRIRRTELLGYRGAAQWILARDPAPRGVCGLEQVSYYCGVRSYYLPSDRAGMLEFLKTHPTDYVVYSEHDVQKSPQYVAMLRSTDQLDPPVTYQGPPGTWKVYLQRVR